MSDTKVTPKKTLPCQNKRKFLFQKQSCAMTVLEYYAKILGCNTFMTRFSHKSRELWKGNLKNWIVKINENAGTIEVNDANIDYWILNTLLQNCSLDLNARKLFRGSYLRKIKKFLSSIPSPSQVKMIKISDICDYFERFRDESGQKCKSRFQYVLEQLSIPLNLEPPHIKTYQNNKGKRTAYFYSNIFSIECVFHRYLSGLQAYPKIDGTEATVFINSKYSVNHKEIRFCGNKSKDCPNLSMIELKSDKIPVFKNILRIAFVKETCFEDIHEKLECAKVFNKIIKKCYPDLEELNPPKTYSIDNTCLSFALQALESTKVNFKVSRIIEEFYDTLKLKARTAILFFPKEHTEMHSLFKCSIQICTKLYKKIKHNLVFESFEVISIANIERIKDPKAELNKIGIDSWESHISQRMSKWLVFPISEIVSINEFAHMENLTIKSEEVTKEGTIIKSNSFYSLVSKACDINIGLDSNFWQLNKLSEPSYYRKMLQHLKGRESSVTTLAIVSNNENLHFDCFTEPTLRMFKKFSVLVLLEDREEEKKEDLLLSKIERYSKLPNFGKIKVCPIKTSKPSFANQIIIHGGFYEIKEKVKTCEINKGSMTCARKFINKLRITPDIEIVDFSEKFWNNS
ncbi:unnamed protein product [Moneuplotes crassus]|uniref:Uncharacterized protein n=1 Tax=Euplotes crassus TaxID=5936 RepID=A0AAD1X0W0_EUPCR|nr:unnamed protein product [Moneuplotes crassus]